MQQFDFKTLNYLVGSALNDFAAEEGFVCEGSSGSFAIKTARGTYVANVALLPREVFQNSGAPYKIDAEHPEIRNKLKKYLGWMINRKILEEYSPVVVAR